MSSPLCELRQGLAIFPFVIFVAVTSSPVFALEQHAPLPGQGAADPGFKLSSEDGRDASTLKRADLVGFVITEPS